MFRVDTIRNQRKQIWKLQLTVHANNVRGATLAVVEGRDCAALSSTITWVAAKTTRFKI